MSKTIKINDVDFTSMFTPVGYAVGYKSIQGNNGGLMLDGSYTEDEISQKAVISLPCMPLNSTDLSSLLSNIYGSVYPKVYYFDPKVGDYREIYTRRNETEQQFRGFGTDGKEYWTGTVITLTEK